MYNTQWVIIEHQHIHVFKQWHKSREQKIYRWNSIYDNQDNSCKQKYTGGTGITEYRIKIEH